MFDESHYTSTATDETKRRLLWPETGSIKVLIELLLVYHMVVVATPVLVEQVGLVNPSVVPEPFTTALYAAVLIAIGTALVWLLVSESIVSIQRFSGQSAIDRYLSRQLPSQRSYLVNGGLTIVGAAVSWITYDRFVDGFVHVIDLFVIVADEFVWTLTIVDGLYVAGFLGGFWLCATGIDRLIVGGVRHYLRHRHGSR